MYTIINSGAHGIHIRPRADISVSIILLEWGEALACHHESALSAAAAQVLGCAQIQQHDLSVRLQHQIVGLDVPVDDAASVYLLQVAHHRLEERDAGLFIDGFSALDKPALQVFTRNIIHDDVGRLVLIEHIPHLDDGIQVAEPGRFSCFPDEALAAQFQFFRCLAAAPENNAVAALAAHSRPGGKILFDTNALFKSEVPRHISDAEAALADHAPDKVMARQHCTTGQGMLRLGSGARGIVETAVRTHPAGRIQFAHAGIAAIEFHQVT